MKLLDPVLLHLFIFSFIETTFIEKNEIIQRHTKNEPTKTPQLQEGGPTN